MVICLYLFDNDTSFVVLMSSVLGTGIELWKVWLLLVQHLSNELFCYELCCYELCCYELCCYELCCGHNRRAALAYS